jgi:putative YjhG/YagF family dehydratase
MPFELSSILDSNNPSLFEFQSHASVTRAPLPLTPDQLRHWPSGQLFGWALNAGMGLDPGKLGSPEYLILSTHGGLRAADGTPIALGYHTGHWEVSLLVDAAARELDASGAIPFAAYCSDPCDGRIQGTTGMFDSLPYRNDAATIFRRLIRCLPTRRGVLGVATCDKGLPAMMMALAGSPDLPAILVPGGVSLLAEDGEDAGKVQSVNSRFAHGQVTLEYASEALCHACASPGGGCQFLGTAASSQVAAEALGLSLPHSALAPSGSPIWLDMARRSARALRALDEKNLRMRDILTPAALENALILHAAFGGSTNLVIHIPAVAFYAGLRRPSVEDWSRINRQTPRLVDALPNGPHGFPTVQVFMAGGVPEVMLHLRRAGLLDTRVTTAAGAPLSDLLDWWEQSERRAAVRKMLRDRDGIDPDRVIMSPDTAHTRGLTSTVCFPVGNLAPGGSVIKSTSIDPSVIDADGVYRKRGPARVFIRETDAVEALKSGKIKAGDVIVLICRGPLGSGMEEVYQVTSALRYLPFGKQVALLTDARFSGVSTGACIGHVTPEALAGGPIGKIQENDIIEIIVDRNALVGTVNVIDVDLDARLPRADLSADPQLPDDTRLWAALQEASGGTWAGAVFDAGRIIALLEAGRGITGGPAAVIGDTLDPAHAGTQSETQ